MSAGRNHHDNGESPRGRSVSPKNTSAKNGAPKNGVVVRHTFRMTIPSELMAGRKAEERILKAIAGSGFNRDSTFAVHLALQEALMNAIKHGNHLDPHKKVRINVSVSKKQVGITIEDEGVGFERGGVPDPRAPENLEKCSGRGIFLIESYMNSVQWTRGGRRVHMVRRNQTDGPHPTC